MEQKNLGSFIWSVVELLRGDFKQSEYGLVILPFTVLRRFECVLDPTRDAVLKKYAEGDERGDEEADRIKRMGNLLAIGEQAGRNPTVRKQLDAGNSEEQILQGGVLQAAVTSAVISMLSGSRDEEDAARLLRDKDAMTSYARLVSKVLTSDLSHSDLMGLS